MYANSPEEQSSLAYGAEYILTSQCCVRDHNYSAGVPKSDGLSVITFRLKTKRVDGGVVNRLLVGCD